jgi:hypothetical protein
MRALAEEGCSDSRADSPAVKTQSTNRPTIQTAILAAVETAVQATFIAALTITFIAANVPAITLPIHSSFSVI